MNHFNRTNLHLVLIKTTKYSTWCWITSVCCRNLVRILASSVVCKVAIKSWRRSTVRLFSFSSLPSPPRYIFNHRSGHLTHPYVQLNDRLSQKPSTNPEADTGRYTRVGTLIVATIYLQLIQNRYMFRSFTVLQCSHQHCVQPVASDVEVVGYL